MHVIFFWYHENASTVYLDLKLFSMYIIRGQHLAKNKYRELKLAFSFNWSNNADTLLFDSVM